MNNQQVEVQFSVLTNKYIKSLILSKYQLKTPLSCRFYTQGLNDIYIIKTPYETYYLRISNYGWRSIEDIKAEIELLKSLCKHELPIAKPIADNDRKFIQVIKAPEGIRYDVLFCEAKGKYQRNFTLEQNCALGKIIAQIHLSTDNDVGLTESRFNIDEKHLVVDPLKIIKPHMLHRINDYNYLKSVSEKLIAYLKTILPKIKPYYGICHGDLHNGNIRISENNITIFDFDCFGYGWRAYDLAVYLWNQKLNKRWNKNTNLKEQWENILSGYNSLRQLSESELEAINIFVIIREIWFLGTQLGSLDMNRGCDWLNDSYFDFHINFISEWIKNNMSCRKIL